MGKNHKHTKKLKSEKNKVHIKSKTKFLPKGQNVTNTTFKIKPIVLQEQLKERGAPGDLLGKHKTNINELISKLKHHNDGVKTEACQDLKDIISGNPLKLIHIYTGTIIQNGSTLIQDRERRVRRAAIKMLNTIFEKINEESLRAFFNYILTNLKCAMTNINRHIQDDSLLLLDAILKYKSTLIAENFDDFFPNFLLLISKLKNQNSGERCLSLNLEGKVTSVKWRVKVLSRLYGILKAMIIFKKDSQKKIIKNTEALDNDFTIYQNNDYALFSKAKPQISKFDEDIPNLIRLLHEIWIEVIPDKSRQSKQEVTVLPTEESVAVCSCIVHIMDLLLQYVHIINHNDTFRDSYFLDQLMANFPYVHNRKKIEMIKELPENFIFHPNCNDENLMVIYIFLMSKKDYRQSKGIASYITNCLKVPNQYNLKLLLRIIKIIVDKHGLCQKIGLDSDEILFRVSQLAFDTKTPEHVRSLYRQLLIDTNHTRWSSKVADLLAEKKITSKLITNILNLCKKNDETVIKVFTDNLTEILNNVRNVEMDEEEAWQSLAAIFFYLKLTEEQIKEINSFIQQNHDLKLSTPLKKVLLFRSFYK